MNIIKHMPDRENSDIVVIISCSLTFYVNFKPLIIKIVDNWISYAIFCEIQRFDVQLLHFSLFYLFLSHFLPDLDEIFIKI